MAHAREPSIAPPGSRRRVRRPVTVVLAAMFSVLTGLCWAALTLTCAVRVVTDAGLGLLFAAATLAPFVVMALLPATNPGRHFVAWIARGAGAGGRLGIIVVVAPVAITAFAFDVDAGQLFIGIFWLVATLVCAAMGLPLFYTASVRSHTDGPRMNAAGPGLVAAVISTLFVLGVVFGDDPWSNWMLAGFALAAIGAVADLCWALPPSRRYVATVVTPASGGRRS